MVGAFFMMKYRERVGDLIGEAEWMNKVGGVYNLIIILSFLIFFWSVAELTNTTRFLFAPVMMLFPGQQTSSASMDF
jgi:hypothetical protein